MNILGVNAYHGDSSACLIRDGILLSAVEEERFRRIKHWAGFPSKSIEYCLASTGINLSDIDVLAINQDSKANIWKKISFTLTKRPDLKIILDRVKNKRQRASIESELEELFPNQSFSGKVAYVEHHEAHLSSAFHVSPFKQAVVVSVDGFGDFASGAWGVGRGNEIDIDERVYFPHSLGIFYQALTQYLGFPHYGDEYKVMGLAPYGKPAYMEEMRQIVLLQESGGYKLNLDYFIHHREKIEYEWENGSPSVGRLFSSAVVELLGPTRQKDEPLAQKHMDIARSIQTMYEEAFFHLLNSLHAHHKLDAVAVAGGCGMNSVANGKIKLKTPFKQIYVQSAAGDAGGAIGAAMVAWYQVKNEGRKLISSLQSSPEDEKGVTLSQVMDHAFWGPSFSDDEIKAVLDRQRDALESNGCTVKSLKDTELFGQTATAIAEGKVIGWFQGRMEWGPRALGNRSILGDPRRSDMKDILNLKIKRRESFRPFAPSILREAVGDWFEQDDEVPFMMKVFQIRAEKREQIPAVTHVDGSGRLQTVYEHTNPRYYALIEAFEKLSGVPMVLNTSFNENEPVVCKPEEALDCFLRTRLDVLVMGNWFVHR
jgi:carbamoyltransferase